MTIVPKIRENILKNGLLNEGDRVLVALSGGADSVALLLSLCEMKCFYVAAAHVNHGIRGDEADRDEAFCKSLCGKLSVEFFSTRIPIPEIAESRKMSLETAAREERYAYLSRLAKEGNFILATAHNANDNLETVLFNLGRGAALKGMCGIPLSRFDKDGVKIVRPLLYISREEIENYLDGELQPYCTDSTNLTDDATRNRIRHNVVPQFLATFPDGLSALSRMTALLNEDSEYLEKCAAEAVERYEEDGVASLKKEEAPVMSRAVRILCGRLCKRTLSEVHTRAVCDAVKSGRGECAVPGGRVVIRKNRLARLEDGGETASVLREIPFKKGEYELWGGYFAKVTEEYTQIYSAVNKTITYRAENCDILLPENAVFRTRRAGDRIFLPKRKVTKPLKKFFNEQKIPPDERDALPLLAVGDRICLLPSDEFKQ